MASQVRGDELVGGETGQTSKTQLGVCVFQGHPKETCTACFLRFLGCGGVGVWGCGGGGGKLKNSQLGHVSKLRDTQQMVPSKEKPDPCCKFLYYKAETKRRLFGIPKT